MREREWDRERERERELGVGRKGHSLGQEVFIRLGAGFSDGSLDVGVEGGVAGDGVMQRLLTARRGGRTRGYKVGVPGCDAAGELPGGPKAYLQVNGSH